MNGTCTSLNRHHVLHTVLQCVAVRCSALHCVAVNHEFITLRVNKTDRWEVSPSKTHTATHAATCMETRTATHAATHTMSHFHNHARVKKETFERHPNPFFQDVLASFHMFLPGMCVCARVRLRACERANDVYTWVRERVRVRVGARERQR